MGSLHWSPKTLSGPCLYLGAHLLSCKVGLWEQVGLDISVLIMPRALCFLRQPQAAALAPSSPVSLFLGVGWFLVLFLPESSGFPRGV